MRLVVQRVANASVTVDGTAVGSIGAGYLVLVGVGREDDETVARDMADKLVKLRVFADDAGKTNLSILDVRGEALVVSQFTLYADTRRGRRPSFTDAAGPGEAARLVEVFKTTLEEAGVPTQEGRFGADMQVSLVNDGPFTLTLDSDRG